MAKKAKTFVLTKKGGARRNQQTSKGANRSLAQRKADSARRKK